MTINWSGLYPASAYFHIVGGLILLRRRQHGKSGHVIGHVPQSDLGLTTNYADTTHHRAAGTHCHDSKDMFNPASYSCPTPIPLLFTGCQLPMPAAFALDMFTKSLILQLVQCGLRSICRISPHIFAGIARIKQFSKYLAVKSACISHFVAANEFMPDINGDVVLVAKERFTVLFRPAGIGIFLPSLCCGTG